MNNNELDLIIELLFDIICQLQDIDEKQRLVTKLNDICLQLGLNKIYCIGRSDYYGECEDLAYDNIPYHTTPYYRYHDWFKPPETGDDYHR